MKCKKCRRGNIGGAMCRMGKCMHCGTDTFTGGGALPKLCEKCSKELSRCVMCAITITP